MIKAEPWSISKQRVWDACKRVTANRGADGVDDQAIEEFDRDLGNNLWADLVESPPGILNGTRKCLRPTSMHRKP